MAIRKSHFSGSWYPGTEQECRRAIESFFGDPKPIPPADRPYKGGIVPHAGWYYSGRLSCNVIRRLKENDLQPETIVLFGKHLHSSGKNSILSEGEWATPLGNLKVDRELAESLTREFNFQIESASNPEPDNTIELQLPFIKYFFPETMILPMGIPPVESSLAIGRRIAQLAASVGRRILFIGSTDLTHYGPNYDFTPQGIGADALAWVKDHNDKKVIERMLRLEAEDVMREALKNGNACCPGAAAAAIAAVREAGGRQGDLLDYYTSYDIRPDASFVGYAGIVFS